MNLRNQASEKGSEVTTSVNSVHYSMDRVSSLFDKYNHKQDAVRFPKTDLFDKPLHIRECIYVHWQQCIMLIHMWQNLHKNNDYEFDVQLDKLRKAVDSLLLCNHAKFLKCGDEYLKLDECLCRLRDYISNLRSHFESVFIDKKLHCCIVEGLYDSLRVVYDKLCERVDITIKTSRLPLSDIYELSQEHECFPDKLEFMLTYFTRIYITTGFQIDWNNYSILTGYNFKYNEVVKWRQKGAKHKMKNYGGS